MKNVFANVSLLLASCAVGLALCEVSLRLFYPKYRGLAAPQVRQDARRLWAREPHARSSISHPDTAPRHLLYHNNLALRHHRNFSEAALAAATNIGVFGDSFVENVRMAVPYSFTEPLDYLLNQSSHRFNVLNFGVNGYGPGQSFLRYQDFRYRDHLDYVLFVYCENDPRNIHETALFHLDEAGRLARHGAVFSPWWVRLISQLHLSYLILDANERFPFSLAKDLIRKKWPDGYRRNLRQKNWSKEHVEPSLYRGTMDDEDFKNSLAIFQRIVRRWKQLVEHNGGAFSVVLLPVTPVDPDVATVLLEEDIKVFDLYDCFGGSDPAHAERHWRDSPYRFKNDGHWNEAGNQLAAICLYRFLEEEMGLPALSEERLGESLQRYYSAFIDEWGGAPQIPSRGEAADVSSHTAAAIREKYLASDTGRSLEKSLKEEIVELVAQPDKRIIISDFDVYLDGNRLIYVKEECRPEDTQAWFFLHVRPVDESDLRPYERQYGFGNRDFNKRGLEIGDGRCVLQAKLPAYPIRQIRTGQFVMDQGKYFNLWEGEFSMDQGAGVGEWRAGN